MSKSEQNQPNPERGSEETEPRFLIIGRIRKPHGVRGELKVTIHTEQPERFNWLETVFLARRELDRDAQAYTIEGVRFAGDDVLLKFKGYDNRETAGRLRQLWVHVPLSEAIPLEEGEYFLYELIGLRVETDDGKSLGTISEIIETGANNVFVVKGEQGEVLLPDTDEVVQEIDFENNVVTVHLISGLLDS